MAYADRVGSLSEGRLTLSSESPGGLGNVVEIRGRQQSA
jgi:hypothetical protein